MLTRYPHWFCDGTFDSAPIGYQLYTIHVLLNETVFCIAKDKTEVTYNKIFSTLKEHNPLLNPASIMIDYERAALNALTQNFPNTEIQGCFFHFVQSIWRHIQAHGLQQRYQNDEEFAIILEQFRALAFVSTIDVIPCYEELVSSLSDELVDDLHDFLNYFERTWIGIDYRASWTNTSSFIFDRIMERKGETNNYV